VRALLIVDLQNDFCPGGRLAVPEGDRIVPVINKLMDKFSLIIASKDWHPEQSRHFDKWPRHCIRETAGAAFHPDLKKDRIGRVFLKGTTDSDDGYSVFEATNENLEEYLKENNVEEIYITGLATEYCVRASALDAARKGFEVYIIKEGVAGIKEDDVNQAVTEMEKAGIELITAGGFTGEKN